MKILGIRLNHDSNLTYFDGDKLYYYKAERDKQIKHLAYHLDEFNIDDLKEAERVFNIDINDIDYIGIVIEDNYSHGPFPDEIKVFQSIKAPIIRVNHHLAHALSGFMLYDNEPNVHIVIDGWGDHDTAWSVIKNNTLVEHGSLRKHGSIGTQMGHAGTILSIESANKLDYAGKIMALQSYGKVDHDYLDLISHYDMYSVKEMFNVDHWLSYKGDLLVAKHTIIDWIATVHKHVEKVLLEFFMKYCDKNDIISYSGGVAQNVVWNTILKKHFKNLIILPHSSDEGLSLGCVEYIRRKFKLPKISVDNFPYIQLDEGTEPVSKKTIFEVAELLANNEIVGWYQNNGEIGPRALGNRSILMDPRRSNGKYYVNQIKKREMYRPFGASILHPYKSTYFDNDINDSYMLYTANCKVDTLESILHVDKSCRVQSVELNDSPFSKLLQKFYELTGCPILLNTSLNVNGKPIAGHHNDAFDLLGTSDLKYLCIGDTIYTKD